MDCGTVRELLLEHDGALDRLDAETRAHVESCPLCVREADLLRRFTASARRAPRPALPPNFTFRVMDRLRAEEAARRPAWRRAFDRLLAPRYAPAVGMAALLLLSLAVWFALPPLPRPGDQAVVPDIPPAPRIAPEAPVDPVAPPDRPDAGGRLAEGPHDFTLDGNALAYASYMTLPEGARVDYRSRVGVAVIEIVEPANLMFVEGEFQLVEGAVNVASDGKAPCRLIGSTETTRVAMTGTVFDLACRNGITSVSCSRGQVDVRTTADESFRLSAGDGARVGLDGRRLAASAAPAAGAADEPLPAGIAYSLAATAEVGAGATPGTEAVPVRNILNNLQNNGIGR